jgi:hypothetical protein
MTAYTIDLNRLCPRCDRGHSIIEREDGLCLNCVRELEPLPRALPDPAPRLTAAQRPTGRGLTGTLFDLILRAEKLADRKFHAVTLERGLRVEVGIGEHFNLRLARLDSCPSAREWQIVMDNLPEAYRPAEIVLPRDFKHTDRLDHQTRWYLEAFWPFKPRTS